MADLTIKYKGNPITELSESGTKTLKTAGKYCEGDISVEYVKPAGGGGGALSFTSQAVGRIPTYQVGHANSEFTINTNMFSATAVGSLQEA